MMTLYHGWRSSASRRVRLCLAENPQVAAWWAAIQARPAFTRAHRPFTSELD